LRFPGRIVGRKQSAYDRHAVGAGGEHVRESLHADSPDRQDGKGARGYSAREGVETDRRAVCAFAGSFEDGTENDEIRTCELHNGEIAHPVARDPDEWVRPEEPSCLSRREGVFGKLNSIRADGQGDVHPIVDQQAGIIAPAQVAQSESEFAKRPCREILCPQLHCVDAAGKCGLDRCE
jgi:hypothetical protein